MYKIPQLPLVLDLETKAIMKKTAALPAVHWLR